MNDQTIELKTFRVNQTSDINTSRLPLIKKEDTKKISNVQKKIEKQFEILNSITNIHKIMTFIYLLLFSDFLYCMFHGYELISCLTDIRKLKMIIIVLIQFIFALYNGVLYLNIFIYYRDLMNYETNKNYLNDNKANVEVNIKIENEVDMRTEIELNMAMQEISKVNKFRVVTWILKYIGFVSILGLQSKFDDYQYLNILIFMFDYYFIITMHFYYQVMLRIEAYKKIYGLKDIKT